MKIFISYKFAEEDKKHLKEFLNKIKEALNKNKHDTLSTFFDAEEFGKKKFNQRQIMDRALKYIEESDKVICIIKSKDKSEGQIFEIGYSIAKGKEVILAIQEGLETRWIEHYANKIIKFKSLKELYKKIEEIK